MNALTFAVGCRCCGYTTEIGRYDSAFQSCSTPVMARFDLRLRCGGQATSTASTCSLAKRDRLVMSKLCGKK